MKINAISYHGYRFPPEIISAPKTSTHQMDTSESGAYTLEGRKEMPILILA